MLLPKVGLGCLLLALLLAPLVGGYPAGAAYGHDDALAAVRLLTFAGLALFRVPEGTRWRFVKEAEAPSLWLGLAALWGVISLLVHSRFLTSPTLLFAMLPATLDGVLFAALGFSLGRFGAAERVLIVRAILLGGAITSGLLLFATLTGEPGTRASIPFFSPNFAAGFLGLCACLALSGLLSDTEKPIVRAAHGALVALSLGGVAATGSRSALVIALVGVFLTLTLLALARRGKLPYPRLGATLAAGVLLAGLIGYGVGARPLAARAAGAGQEQSGLFRTWTWRGTLDMARTNLALGTGPGTFPYRYPAYAKVGTTGLAHSSYLELAAERGVPALVLMLGALGLAGFAALKRVKTDPLSAALLGALAVGAARSVFDSEWAILGNALPLFAVMGLCGSPGPDNGETLSPRSPGGSVPGEPNKAVFLAGSPLLGPGAALAALLCLPFVRALWPPQADNAPTPEAKFAIEPSLRIAFPAARNTPTPEEGIVWLERGRSVDPANFQLLKALAEAYELIGQKEKALGIWRELAEKSEDNFGKIRALPEATDTNPAWAFAALGQWEKVTEIIESYSRTPPAYQTQELILAARTEIVRERREKLKLLYSRACTSLKLPEARRLEILARIDAMASRI